LLNHRKARRDIRVQALEPGEIALLRAEELGHLLLRKAGGFSHRDHLPLHLEGGAERVVFLANARLLERLVAELFKPASPPHCSCTSFMRLRAMSM
jgi:hypothetical protein